MAFAFNFAGPNDTSNENERSCFEKETNSDEATISVPCKRISFQDISFKNASHEKAKMAKFGDLEIRYMTQELISNEVENLGLISDQKYDLIPGKYEGGFKVWESSFDLVQFLVEKNCIRANTSVLELGCGAGLPGIAAYLLGATVTFQDFNSEVLELVTATNVILNTPAEKQCNIEQKCDFLSGDWQCILDTFYGSQDTNKKFDFILTSETLYEKSNHRKLLNLMKNTLKATGVIYLASKVHYFGVGGGTSDFEDLVMKDNTFDISTVLRVDGGVERRILKLVFRNV